MRVFNNVIKTHLEITESLSELKKLRVKQTTLKGENELHQLLQKKMTHLKYIQFIVLRDGLRSLYATFKAKMHWIKVS